jgi:hypothetical protein
MSSMRRLLTAAALFYMFCASPALTAAAAPTGATQRQPCVPLQNAARPGSCMPLTGLGAGRKG